MSAKKTAWHPPFTDLLQQRRPRWATVGGEVQLTVEPLRVDDLIELWAEALRDLSDDGGTLRAMWRRIRRVGLLEYKSIVWPFHHGDLYRLLAYGMVWLFAHQEREKLPDGSLAPRWTPEEVTLILAVPSINKALRDELAALRLVLPDSGTGYHAVTGALLPLLVIDLGVVAEREDDDVLRWFAGLPQRTVVGEQWVMQHQGNHGGPMSTQATPDLFGYDEWVRQAMKNFTLEQRLEGLAPEELVLALPDEALRALSDEYVAALSEDVQGKLRARRGR